MRKFQIISTLFFVVVLSSVAWAGKSILRSEKITIETRSQAEGTFAVYVKFDLAEALPRTEVDIDFATLKLTVQLAEPMSKESRQAGAATLHILAAGADLNSPDPGFSYNTTPVSTHFQGRGAGAVLVEADLTPIVRAWLSGRLPNHGILLVSHRLATEKALRVANVGIDTESAVITIYWTSMVGK